MSDFFKKTIVCKSLHLLLYTCDLDSKHEFFSYFFLIFVLFFYHEAQLQGPVHAYVAVERGRASYLSELKVRGNGGSSKRLATDGN